MQSYIYGNLEYLIVTLIAIDNVGKIAMYQGGTMAWIGTQNTRVLVVRAYSKEGYNLCGFEMAPEGSVSVAYNTTISFYDFTFSALVEQIAKIF